MSRFSPSSHSCSDPLDEAEEARELEAFFRRQDPVEVAAVDWHTRREQGLTAAEQAEFQQWLEASPAHAAAVGRLDQGMAALRSIPAEEAVRVHGATHSPTSNHRFAQSDSFSQTDPMRRGEGRRAGNWIALTWLRPRQALVALCCAALLGVGIGWYQWSQQTFSNSYAVARGQSQTVTLPDGTELAFDAETQAQVTWHKDRREVRLTEGQIIFAVAPDSEKPFQVLAGPVRVTVVGTRFSVRYRHAGMDAGAVKVAVEEGHVRVADARNPRKGSSTAVDLVAGQGLTVSPDGTIGQVAGVAPGSIALWRKGMVRFENTRLGDALTELERYGPTGLVIHDPDVAALTIGGSYQIDRPDAFARMVSQILPVRLMKNAAGKTEIAKAR